MPSKSRQSTANNRPPKSQRPTLAQALRLEQIGKRRQAIEMLGVLSAKQPNNATVWFRLGTMLDASGKMAFAIPCYLRALRLRPRHPQRYFMCLYLCSSYRKIGRPQAAQRWLREAESFGRTTPLQHRLKRLLNRNRS